MMAHTHLLIGAAAGIAVGTTAGLAPGESLALAALAGVAALIPDIDHPDSTIRHKLGAVGNVLLFWLPHRGFTHTLLALGLLTIVLMVAAPPLLAVAVIAGYASHILADMLTPTGLPVLWPVYRNNLHLAPTLLRVRTNSITEQIIAIALFALVATALLHHP